MHEKREKQTAKVIHTTKLFGGRETAQEVHRKHAWHGGRCQGCSSPNIAIRITCAMSPKELTERAPVAAAKIMAQTDSGQIPSFQSKWGPLTIFSEAYACGNCQQVAERAAARLPSYVYVDIDRGVGDDKVIGQVPASFLPERPKATT